MGPNSKLEYLKSIYQRYRKGARAMKKQILDEFTQVCGYNRKYAIRLLNAPLTEKPRQRRKRDKVYHPAVISILEAIWEVSGYPWARRLKAILSLWLPWAKRHFHITPEIETQLFAISPATIDRRLAPKKRRIKRRIYGTTRPGILLKHEIPIKTDSWDICSPGFMELDLVSHSGSSAEGDFIYSLDCVDIHAGWTERRAVMGRSQKAVLDALAEVKEELPFPLRAIDSDNDSGFINYHLKAFCDKNNIQFYRSRPYKKDDNAHVEQKNWTHVRKIFGYVRYDSEEALQAMNDLYRNELRWFQNLFLPSVKLLEKVRIGSKFKRVHDEPLTPLQRVCACKEVNPEKIQQMMKLFHSLDPFELSRKLDQKLNRIYDLASENRRARKVHRNQY